MIQKIAAVLFGAILFLVSFSPIAAQQNTDFGLEISANQSSSPQILTGDLVEITEPVTAELYVLADRVVIDTQLEQDVLILARQVELQGQILADVRILAQTVQINGEVLGTVSALAQRVTQLDQSFIASSILAMAQEVVIDGEVGQGVVLAANRVVIGGVVDGITSVHADRLQVTADAELESLNGKVVQSPEISDLAIISPEDIELVIEPNQNNWFGEILRKIILFLGFTLLAVVVRFLIPKLGPALSGATLKRPLLSLMFGLIGILVTPPLVLLAAISILGLPVALLGLCLVFVTIIISPVAIAIIWGEWIAQLIGAKKLKSWHKQSLGAALLVVVWLLPSIISVLAWIFGLASVVGSIVVLAVNRWKL